MMNLVVKVGQLRKILTDVMGMAETRTEAYLNGVNNFNLAIENENFFRG